MPFSEIKWDTIILKDGWLRAILKVSGLNLDLKNYDEQQLVLTQYKKFLNWLQFPLQILVRNTYLDLSDYISFVKGKVGAIDYSTLKESGEQYVSFLEDIDIRTWLIYVKEFYIIVPYYAWGEETASVQKPWWMKFLDVLNMKDSLEKIVARYRVFVKHEKFLNTRCMVITDGLSSLWMTSKRLALGDIIALLFRVYNPTLHSGMASYDQ